VPKRRAFGDGFSANCMVDCGNMVREVVCKRESVE